MATMSQLISSILNNLNAKVVAQTATSDEVVLQTKAIQQLNDSIGILDPTSQVLTGNNVDFYSSQVFTKTLTESTTLTFSNYQVGAVKDLVITGNFSLTFSTGIVNITAGLYDGSRSNLIQVICTNAITPIFWISISKSQI